MFRIFLLLFIFPHLNIKILSSFHSFNLIDENSDDSPNGHSTSNRRRFDVDITSICRRPNFAEFPRRFHVLFQCNFADRKIKVISTYFVQCNFDGGKIHVVSTYFFRCNFDGGKIHVVSTYFFWCNFDDRKTQLVSTYFFRCNFFRRNIHSVCTYFFRRNFDGRIIHFVCKYFFRQNVDEFNVVVGKLQANENIWESFPFFVTLKSWLLQDCSL